MELNIAQLIAMLRYKMGNFSKLIKKMHKTKKEFDDKMNEHIREMDKIRAIIKYNSTNAWVNKQNFCQHCGGKL